MTLSRQTFAIQDAAGNSYNGTDLNVEVRREVTGQPLATGLFSDAAGGGALGNPFTVNNGEIAFNMAADVVQVRAYIGPSGSPTFERIWNGVEFSLRSQRIITDAGDITMLVSDGIILVNKIVGEATGFNLISAAIATMPITLKDLKGDAATNNITLNPDGAETIDGAASAVISVNKGSLTLHPLDDGSGWFTL